MRKMASKKKLGLIVNPIAGMGGRVGLKGTDGQDILEKAIRLGAVPISPRKAVEALSRISSIKDSIELFTYPHEMGEEEARECTFDPNVVGSVPKAHTTPTDTKNAAKEMLRLPVGLLLFAGGDGTARDICEAVGEKLTVLGIPAGAKMHSGVFAINPERAGDLAARYLQERVTSTREAEVMDVDEQAFREDRVQARLYGYLRIPNDEDYVQASKASSPPEDKYVAEAIASDFIENIQPDCAYIFGPGTTTRAIVEKMGLRKTLLGVDVVYNGRLLASDVNEKQLLELAKDRKTKIVVTVIGQQGFIFGRGSQQISPDIIKKVGKENIVVVATPNKLTSLRGKPLLVDTGDRGVDAMMTGYLQVITGYRTRAAYRVRSS
jgi:predicted polyphosphate/ATP-dependent NAD kinase